MLARADAELEPDALVAREQRQEPVGRGGADDLDAAALPRSARNAADEIAVGLVEAAAAAAVKSLAPELDERQQCGSPVAASDAGASAQAVEPLREEGLQLLDELGAGQLVGEDRRECRSSRAPAPASALERLERLEQRAGRCRAPPRRASRCRAASGRD